jgi:hypothetical protein
MNDQLALVWLNDLLERLERSPQREDPAEYHRRTAVRHAIKVIRWREKLLRMMDVRMDGGADNG